MPLITIAEHPGPDGANAVVSFDHGPEHPIQIADPFDEKEEADLEWYFEDYLTFPFVEQVRYQTAAASIQHYGEALFREAFSSPKAQREYGVALAGGLDGLSFEIKGSPEFHRLHWEALKDPELPRAFALDCPLLRRNTTPPVMESSVKPSDTLRVLLVTSRPFGDQDVAYRTISRPLVEATRNVQLAVDIHILRPASYQALAQHLEQTRDRHGAGWYHIAHFDTHGAVLSYDEFTTTAAIQGNYSSGGRYGRSDIAPYPDKQGFLFLDGDCLAGSADPVSASELADLLADHGIHAVVLNACQSAKQVGANESSLGARLMQAGVQWVLAMGYSVTVSAAEKLMTSLYCHLYDGAPLSAALRRARLELHKDKERRVYYDQRIALEDWLLPVVYENRPLVLKLVPPTPEALAARLLARAGAYRAPEVAYGFLGRDLDVLRIERRLLADNLLLLRGMAGAGKSTLLRHLAEWWQTTHFVEQVAYASFEDQVWPLERLLHHLAQDSGLLDATERQAWTALPDPAQEQLMIERLRGRRHLLILDNLESVTGAHLAIPNTLNEQQQSHLRAFLDSLAGGRSLVLLGSRGPEDWLIGDDPRRVYELAGLDPEAASTLAERVLEKIGASHHRSDPELEHLMRLLAGFPLANLARQTSAEVLQALTQGDSGLDLGAGGDKNASLLRCIEYSYNQLDPGAQDLLTCLAPFRGVFFTGLIEPYTNALHAQPTLADLPFERWQEMLTQAANWGLVTSHEVNGYLRLQPTLLWFLRSCLTGDNRQSAILMAFRETISEAVGELADMLQSIDSRQLGEKLTRLEYENLLYALELSLDARAEFIQIYMALSFYLDITDDQARCLELGQRVITQLDTWSEDKLAGVYGVGFIGVLDDVAKRHVHLRNHDKAEAIYLKLIEIISANQELKAEAKGLMLAVVNHQLGLIAQRQRHWEQAEGKYNNALSLKNQFNIRHSLARTHHQLGLLAQEQKHWNKAEEHYRTALALHIEFNDMQGAAGTYHQLGFVSQAKNEWKQAEHSYHKALDIWNDTNQLRSRASTYHQLGTVAYQQKHWEQANNHYKSALAIWITLNNNYEQAGTYHQLGIVSQEQHHLDQATSYYNKALNIYIDLGELYKQAGGYHQLGRIAEKRGNGIKAQIAYIKSLAIYRQFDDSHNQAICLRNLAGIHRTFPTLDIPAKVAKTVNITTEMAINLLNYTMENNDGV